MLNQHHTARPWIALPTAFSLILSTAVPLVSAPGQAPAAAAQAESEAPAQSSWPRWFETSSGGTVVMYAPQVESWDGQKHMIFRAAVHPEDRERCHGRTAVYK